MHGKYVIQLVIQSSIIIIDNNGFLQLPYSQDKNFWGCHGCLRSLENSYPWNHNIN